MKLNLANPIVFFDLETTGINIAKTGSWKFRY